MISFDDLFLPLTSLVALNGFTPRAECRALWELLPQEADVDAHQMKGDGHSEEVAMGCLFLHV